MMCSEQGARSELKTLDKVSKRLENIWQNLNMSQCCKLDGCVPNRRPCRGGPPSLDRRSYKRVADLVGCSTPCKTRHSVTCCWFLDHDYKLPNNTANKSKSLTKKSTKNPKIIAICTTATWIMATYFRIVASFKLSWSSSKAKSKLWAHANENNQCIDIMTKQEP
jgi:hypothetical protein